MHRPLHHAIRAFVALALVAVSGFALSETGAGSSTPIGPRYQCATDQVLLLAGDVITCKRSVTATVVQTRVEIHTPHCPSTHRLVSVAGIDTCKPIEAGTPLRPVCVDGACPTNAKCGKSAYKVDYNGGLADRCGRDVSAPVVTTVVDYFAPIAK